MGVDEIIAGDRVDGAGDAGGLSNDMTARLFGSLISTLVTLRGGI